MKKTILLVAMTLLVVAMSAGSAFAIAGACANCHTMHNSQNGAAVSATGPNAKLLIAGCIGCHAQALATNFDSNNIPQVDSTNASPLAGGSFATAKTTTSAGHNPFGAAASFTSDAVLTAPPGASVATGITQLNFSCSGTLGCHGNRSVATGADIGLGALQGAHHANTNGAITAAPASVGGSYRFLYGVMGYEDTDWENTKSVSDHNQYKGVGLAGVSDATLTSPGAGGTISGLCAECHGNFHGGSGDTDTYNAAWLRHPTDHIVPNSGEYTGAFGGAVANNYDVNLPVASVTVTGPITDISPGANNMIVMCLTCHKAHGSQYADALRWNYTTSTAAGTGCLKCHTNKLAY